jgi:hypothetical protein
MKFRRNSFPVMLEPKHNITKMVSNSPCFNAAFGANRLHNALSPTSINRVKTTLKKRETPEVKELPPEPEIPSP